MGQHFGELAKVHGIVIHKISPFEQKAFAGVFSKGIPNTFRRFRSQVFRVAPPFIVGIFAYNYVESLHDSYMRKDPAEFANDV